MQSRDCGVEEEQRYDERSRPFARESCDHCQHPQQGGNNSHVQASDSEKVKSAGLLKWFLDVFRCLVPEAKHDSAEKILHLRCVLQSSANCVLHPCARLLRET